MEFQEKGQPLNTSEMVSFFSHFVKVIHRDISFAYFFLIVDLRERGTLLQQKNGLKKSQAQKI